MMIQRIITKTIIPLARLYGQSALLIGSQRFNFAKVKKAKQVIYINTILEEQIKAQKSSLNNLTSYEKEFAALGWLISHQHTLIQLQKTVGEYHVRLLSNIKPPNQYNKEYEGLQKRKVEINQVTLYATKSGSQKTAVFSTIVTEGFKIINIHFSPNFQEAKASRRSIFNSNTYTGRQIRRIPKKLRKPIKNFIEGKLEVNDELMESFADYCLESEQSFYMDWLKDFKAIVD